MAEKKYYKVWWLREFNPSMALLTHAELVDVLKGAKDNSTFRIEVRLMSDGAYDLFKKHFESVSEEKT